MKFCPFVMLLYLRLTFAEKREVDKERCFFKADRGPCNGRVNVFAFDIFSNRCIMFSYGNCGGNPNRFATETECRAACFNQAIDGVKKKKPEAKHSDSSKETQTAKPEQPIDEYYNYPEAEDKKPSNTEPAETPNNSEKYGDEVKPEKNIETTEISQSETDEYNDV